MRKHQTPKWLLHFPQLIETVTVKLSTANWLRGNVATISATSNLLVSLPARFFENVDERSFRWYEGIGWKSRSPGKCNKRYNIRESREHKKVEPIKQPDSTITNNLGPLNHQQLTKVIWVNGAEHWRSNKSEFWLPPRCWKRNWFDIKPKAKFFSKHETPVILVKVVCWLL